MLLFGANSENAQLTCGTINSVNEGASLATQTYTVPCAATTEPTLSVSVWDKVQATGDNKNYKFTMNIAEVMVYSQVNGKVLGREKR